MKMRNWLSIVLLLACGACGTGYAGSCSTIENGMLVRCVEYCGVKPGIVKELCQGDYSESTCPREQAVASCEFTRGYQCMESSGAVQQAFFYPPFTMKDVMEICAKENPIVFRPGR